MRKLLAITTAILGLSLNAAICTWDATALAGIDGVATSIDAGSIYGFESTTITQQALLTAFLAKATNESGWTTALSKGFGADDYDGGDAVGVIDGYGNGAEVNSYLAILDGDNLYISGIESGATGDAGQDAFVSFDLADSIGNKLAAGTTTYSGAGWYAVPEPTSGLLLLLGVAGLALKRKRA